jgi:hypothetical protein
MPAFALLGAISCLLITMIGSGARLMLAVRLWDLYRHVRVDLEANDDGYRSIVNASVTSLNSDDDTSTLPVGSGDRRSCRVRFVIFAAGAIPGSREPEFSDAELVEGSAYEANARQPESADLTNKRVVV